MEVLNVGSFFIQPGPIFIRFVISVLVSSHADLKQVLVEVDLSEQGNRLLLVVNN